MSVSVPKLSDDVEVGAPGHRHQRPLVAQHLQRVGERLRLEQRRDATDRVGCARLVTYHDDASSATISGRPVPRSAARRCDVDRSIDRRVARCSGTGCRQADPASASSDGFAAERHRRHDHPRRADAALRAAVLDERALQRMTAAEPFDRRHARAGDLRDRHQARVHRHAVDQHRARAALAFAAAFFRAGQRAVLAQHVEQALHRMDGSSIRAPFTVQDTRSTKDTEVRSRRCRSLRGLVSVRVLLCWRCHRAPS